MWETVSAPKGSFMFSEGWVDFDNKKCHKRVFVMLYLRYHISLLPANLTVRMENLEVLHLQIYFFEKHSEMVWDNSFSSTRVKYCNGLGELVNFDEKGQKWCCKSCSIRKKKKYNISPALNWSESIFYGIACYNACSLCRSGTS